MTRFSWLIHFNIAMGNDSPKGEKKGEAKGFKSNEELEEDIYILDRL